MAKRRAPKDQEALSAEAREERDVRNWWEELQDYRREAKKWRDRSRKIYERYTLAKAESDSLVERPKFNILWSTIETQTPAIFGRLPVPAIERRWKDRDDTTRISALTLERAVSTDLEFDDFETIMTQVAKDYQITARGTARVFHEPDIRESEVELSIAQGESGPVYRAADGTDYAASEVTQRKDGTAFALDSLLLRERATVGFVHWEDYAHRCEKTWAQLQRTGWVAFRVPMEKDAAVERFGAAAKSLSFDGVKADDQDSAYRQGESKTKTADVWEIWDARQRCVKWAAKGYPRWLDKVDDPYRLDGFFPCPRPCYGTTATDSLIPTPDYEQWRPFAIQLDDVTERIDVITRALQVKGVYDATIGNLANLLSDMTPENEMIGIPDFARWRAAGGKIEDLVWWMPIDQLAKVLISLYDARDRLKQIIFEISGMSDILRGQVDPREKLGQSKIKGQFATLRIGTKQKELARFARDLVRIKAEIIAELFSDDTIRKTSGFDAMQEVQAAAKAQQAALATPPQPGAAPPQIPPGPDQIFAGVLQLLREDRLRSYRIDIETDTTVALDEEEEKAARIEFLAQVGTFLKEVVPLAERSPDLAVIAGEMLLYGVRSFKAGRSLEGAFEAVVDKLQSAAMAAAEAPPQPSPEQQAEAARLELEKAKLQLEQQIAQADFELRQAELQLKHGEAATDAALRQADQAHDARKLSIDAAKAMQQPQRTQ